MASSLKQILIQIPQIQSWADVQQAISQAFQQFQNKLLAQFPITNMGGQRLTNVAVPQDADDVVTLRYLTNGGYATSTATSASTASRVTSGTLVEVQTSAATYNLPASGVDVVTLNSGVITCNLPSLSGLGARPIWLINAAGTNITLSPQTSQTIEGNSYIIFYPNTRLQLMPNA